MAIYTDIEQMKFNSEKTEALVRELHWHENALISQMKDYVNAGKQERSENIQILNKDSKNIHFDVRDYRYKVEKRIEELIQTTKPIICYKLLSNHNVMDIMECKFAFNRRIEGYSKFFESLNILLDRLKQDIATEKNITTVKTKFANELLSLIKNQYENLNFLNNPEKINDLYKSLMDEGTFKPDCIVTTGYKYIDNKMRYDDDLATENNVTASTIVTLIKEENAERSQVALSIKQLLYTYSPINIIVLLTMIDGKTLNSLTYLYETLLTYKKLCAELENTVQSSEPLKTSIGPYFKLINKWTTTTYTSMQCLRAYQKLDHLIIKSINNLDVAAANIRSLHMNLRLLSNN